MLRKKKKGNGMEKGNHAIITILRWKRPSLLELIKSRFVFVYSSVVQLSRNDCSFGKLDHFLELFLIDEPF